MTIDSVAIIGAGPYGLSLSAHLTARGVPHSIFGPPMDTWKNHMPSGMFLKSEGFATSLYAPRPGYSLRDYCRQHHLPYAEIGLPVTRKLFVDYGLHFQQSLVPHLDPSWITNLRQLPDESAFELTTSNGTTHLARRVVLAVGITPFPFIPPELAVLPRHLVSHSAQYSDVTSFRNQRVLVLGAGSSAVDLAIELADSGALPELLARASRLAFHPPPQEPRPLRQRLLYPRAAIGVGWRSKLANELPLIFHTMPRRLRHRVVARHLGPSPGWFARAKFQGRVTAHLSATFLSATPQPEANPTQLLVRFQTHSGDQETRVYDHLIAATGYKPWLSRIPFLDASLRDHIATEGTSAKVDRNFQTTVPGLYMVGLAAANNFGPLLRFACGAEFTVKRLAPHLARQR